MTRFKIRHRSRAVCNTRKQPPAVEIGGTLQASPTAGRKIGEDHVSGRRTGICPAEAQRQHHGLARDCLRGRAGVHVRGPDEFRLCNGRFPAHIAEARQNAGVGSLFLPSPHVTSHVAASQPLFVEVASRDVQSAEAASQPADAMFQTVALNDADANETSFAQAGQELPWRSPSRQAPSSSRRARGSPITTS